MERLGVARDSLAYAAIKAVAEEADRVYGNTQQESFCLPYARHWADVPGMVWRPYCWDECGPDVDSPNLEWGGVSVWWYKYLGRSMEYGAAREMSPDSWAEWLRSAIAALAGHERRASSPPHV